MDETHLYQKIAEEIRKEILEGRLQQGDRLPSIRSLVQRWKCTPGTVQRAYHELAEQGLVVSRAGKGTHVAGGPGGAQTRLQAPLRRAVMVHRAEAFLLQSLTAGYSIDEIQASIDLALDRWRSLEAKESAAGPGVIRFSGSHDMAMVWISSHIADIAPGVSLQMQFTGSLGGLMALAEGKAEIAGCHLWDVESNTYNLPFVRKVFPGRTLQLVRLADRRMGLILPSGNPLGIAGLAQLAAPGVRFVNRQPGSGTRVWLDAQLQRIQVDASSIAGYDLEVPTHSAAAREIAEGRANAAVGLHSAAASFGLDFLPLAKESYDLVLPAELAKREPFQALLAWLATPSAKTALSRIPGYDTAHTGEFLTLVL
jgi:putative molybdopterin biosynthesis protein